MNGPPVVEGWEDRLVVERNYEGWRLDRWLTQKLRRATRSQAARIVREGAHFADGRPAKASARLRAGDVVVLPREERCDPGAPSLDAVRVVAQGDGWVALDKPPGMLVHRTAAEGTRTVDAWLAAAYPSDRVEPVHRLDRDTSGLLIAGAGIDAIRDLKALLAGREVRKLYVAAVADPGGLWVPGCSRSLDAPLGFDEQSEVRLRVGVGAWGCATHARCLSTAGGRALLLVGMDGGRQHQIRAHLSLAGTPLLGDKLYEAGDTFFLDWIASPGDASLVARLPTRWHCLHAWRIAFPWRGTTVSLEAPPPPFLSALGFDAAALDGASDA